METGGDMPKEIKISVPLAVTIAFFLVLIPFLAGFTVGFLWSDDERENIAVLRVHNEMRNAIRENKPFYLTGSNIKITPRKDSTGEKPKVNARIEYQIAGAGDEGYRRVWER